MHPLHDLTLAELRQRTSLKWQLHGPDVLPLWVAEMDVRLAPPVADAVTAAVAAGDTGYPYGPAYAEAFADFAGERWGWNDVDPQRTALVADVMTGLVEAIALVSSPGDPVVINPPVYPPFFQFVDHAARHIVEAPLGADGRLDLETLEAAFIRAGVDGRPVTYLLCNPQNPTAVAHSAEDLGGVAALAQTYRVRVVVDEIHAPLVPDGFVPYLSVPGSSNAMSVVSASKAWNLAGMKAALLVAGQDAATDLAVARDRGPRSESSGCARSHHRDAGGSRLARRPAGRSRRQSDAPGRAARGAPARGSVGRRGGDLPRVDRLP
ncbi:aminotransferase class I/II-fold pyridoxal phosphate-dependent enzyme [Aeromicrobium sp.]|uniref:aminotransferase class I/II-fold pyridoxal phosphate-dependent enzyme n=1 Tax=Aeromicrobium sp. TaxID=1871063 RepID=UPI0030BB4B44